MTIVDRPSWDDLYIEMAESASRRSLCVRSQTGAVIADVNHRVVSIGYNQAPDAIPTVGRPCSSWCPRGMGLSHQPGFSDCYAIHAEGQALLHADRTKTRRGTIYITRHPCMPCAKEIVGSGIVRAVLGADDGGVYHRPDESADFLRMCGVEVVLYG